MVVATKSDIAKKDKAYQSYLKQLDEDGRLKDKKAMSSLRSAIRREWMRNPTKLAVLHEAMVVDTDPNTRTKWLYRCNIDKKLYKLADVEVDHKQGEHSLLDISDFEEYYQMILRVKKDDLQVLSRENHNIKTYAERYKVSWDEAVKKKAMILKLKQTASEQKKELLKHGFTKSEITNSEKREECYEKLYMEGKL